jgi:catechol 2,3-dioxygenase-like lactoylglutathione lyase family enzyme
MASGVLATSPVLAEESEDRKLVARPGLFQPLTEPPCSYCSTQHRKQFVQDDDLVLAWIRGAHNGGAISVRHFLAGPRVINDTYGLFFYDPDGIKLEIVHIPDQAA